MSLRKAYGIGGGESSRTLPFAATVEVNCSGIADLRMIADAAIATSYTLNKPGDTTPCNFLLTVSVINGTVDLVLGANVTLVSGEWNNAEGAVNVLTGAWDGVTLRLTHIGPGVDLADPEVLSGANAVQLDGVADYLSAVSLTGEADGKLGIVSLWARLNRGSLGATRYLFTGFQPAAQTTVQVQVDNLHNIFVSVKSPAGANLVSFAGTGEFFPVDGYAHIIASWDLATATQRAECYIDDVDVPPSAITDAEIDYTPGGWNVGAWNNGDNKADADIAELYFNMAETLDLDVVANRRKFRTVDGKPVELGSDGSTPTGTAPILFLSGPTASWHTNKGDGGGLTENGALTDASEGI